MDVPGIILRVADDIFHLVKRKVAMLLEGK